MASLRRLSRLSFHFNCNVNTCGCCWHWSHSSLHLRCTTKKKQKEKQKTKTKKSNDTEIIAPPFDFRARHFGPKRDVKCRNWCYQMWTQCYSCTVVYAHTTCSVALLVQHFQLTGHWVSALQHGHLWNWFLTLCLFSEACVRCHWWVAPQAHCNTVLWRTTVMSGHAHRFRSTLCALWHFLYLATHLLSDCMTALGGVIWFRFFVSCFSSVLLI